MNNLKWLLFFCFFASFISCGKEDNPKTVDPEFELYLDRFIKEGAKRGKTLDIDKDGGVIMEFADLTPPTIGLCYNSLPVRIQIDRDYWKKTADSYNKENLREDVVFHELAHGFLKRGHRNDSLPNNEWTSMMCGEPQINGRDWLINFNGYRREYYLDELFNQNTPTPKWSNPAVFDGNKGYLVYSDDFPSPDLSVHTNETLTFKIGQGMCEISSSDDENRLLSLHSVFVTSDFYMEVEMAVTYTLGKSLSGLFSGYQQWDWIPGDYDYFTISPGNRSYIRNSKCFVPFAEVLTSDKLIQGEFNKLAICKKGGELFCYINDELIYRNDYLFNSYNTFGVITPAKGVVYVKNFSLYSYSQSALKSAQQEKFRIMSEKIPFGTGFNLRK